MKTYYRLKQDCILGPKGSIFKTTYWEGKGEFLKPLYGGNFIGYVFIDKIRDFDDWFEEVKEGEGVSWEDDNRI